MPGVGLGKSERARRGALRTRFIPHFLIPVLLVGAGMIVAIELLLAAVPAHDAASTAARVGYVAVLLVALSSAAGLALYVGERMRRPLVWLLRAMDSGQVRLLSDTAGECKDWEMGVLAQRVQVLLQQNLSGAQAMEQLDGLRDDVAALLDAATSGRFHGDAGKSVRAEHPLARRLRDYLVARSESAGEARGGLLKLQGLLEHDWREETQRIEDLAKRTERCFLTQTQVAMELEQLERLWAANNGSGGARGAEVAALLGDLRQGFAHWMRASDDVSAASAAADGSPGPEGRRRAWSDWVEESLELLEASVAKPSNGESAGPRAAVRLKRLAGMAAEASQESGILSREAAQLQRTWLRLGERLRSLMARVGEVHEGMGEPTRPSPGGNEIDGQS